MIYQAKKDSEAYNFIKSVCLKEKEEYEAYKKRVLDAIGFDFETFSGYLCNRSLNRKCCYCSIDLPKDKEKELDMEAWKIGDRTKNTISISPNKRYKKGKEINKILNSFKPVSSHFEIHRKLGIKEPPYSCFKITQMFFNNNNAFVYFDDYCRADKENKDLVEITISEYEKLSKEE